MPALFFPLLLMVLSVGASNFDFEDARSAVLVGIPPAAQLTLRLSLRSGTAAQPSVKFVRERLFSPSARIAVQADGRSRELLPPALGVYRARLSSGPVSATFNCSQPAGLCALNGIYQRRAAGEVFAVSATLRLDGAPMPITLVPATQDGRLGSRQLQLISPAPPYARLSGCPRVPTMYVVKMGLLLDVGFVSARGGRNTALLDVAEAVSRANSVFEDQLGLSLLIEHMVINEGSGGSFSQTGPNEAPADGSGTRTCASYVDTSIVGHGETVTISGAEVALGKLANWVGNHAPSAGLWHLFTDCFPSPGTVGLGSINALCDTAQRLNFGDSGQSPPGGDTDACADGVVEATGNCISTYTNGQACASGEYACSANTAWTTSGVNLWHTFAHEVGHNLGGRHTFNGGGLMAYSEERALYDAGDICSNMNSVLSGSNNCLTLVASCGDGNVEGSEECDDSNHDDGDGCSAECQVECGFLCTIPYTESGAGSSVCTLGCGNSVIDHELGEECDTPDACCLNCMLVAGGSCCGGECCDSSGDFRPSSTLCAGDSGHCVSGNCKTSAALCDRYSNLVLAPVSCPISGSNACRQRCKYTTSVNCYGSADYTIEDGSTCLTSADVLGACSAGECLSSATCGNGVVERGEACESTSTCCIGCQLPPGAECSSGECCDSDCRFKDPTARCGSSLKGFCLDGTCETASSLCTSYAGRSIDTSVCPMLEDQPCARRCMTSSGSCELFLVSSLASEDQNVLPDGTRCLPTSDPAVLGSCIGGVCKPLNKCETGLPPYLPLSPGLPPAPPLPPLPPPTVVCCQDSCSHAGDGGCDDGGPGNSFNCGGSSCCPFGTGDTGGI